MIATKEQIWEELKTIWRIKRWDTNPTTMGEWGSFIFDKMKVEHVILQKACEAFSTDPKAQEIGHLFSKINTVITHAEHGVYEPPDLSKYKHKGLGPDLATDTMEVLDMEPPEKWQKLIALSKRMINEGPEGAKAEWYNTLRYAEKELDKS